MSKIVNLFIYLYKVYKFRTFKKNTGNIGLFSRVLNPRQVSAGGGTFIGKFSRIEAIDYYNGEELQSQIVIGNDNHFGWNTSILCAEKIEIGDHNLFASEVLITDIYHGMDAGSQLDYRLQSLDTKPVIIGNGCWIGQKVSILPGTSIGNKCIIGANSVVTNDIPEYTIAVGAPAKVVKKWDFDLCRWVREEL